MNKIASFVRKYGEEIGVLAQLLSVFLLRLIPNQQDRAQAQSQVQRLLDASESIANSWHELRAALPEPGELLEQVRPAILELVAELVAAEREKIIAETREAVLASVALPPPEDERPSAKSGNK